MSSTLPISQVTSAQPLAAAIKTPLELLIGQVRRFVEERVLINGPTDLPEPYKVAFFAVRRGQIVLHLAEEIHPTLEAAPLASVKQFYERAADQLSRELTSQGADRDATLTVNAVFLKSLGEALVTMRAMKAVCSASTHMKHTAAYLPNIAPRAARENLDAYFENYPTNHTIYDEVSKFLFGSHVKK